MTPREITRRTRTGRLLALAWSRPTPRARRFAAISCRAHRHTTTRTVARCHATHAWPRGAHVHGDGEFGLLDQTDPTRWTFDLFTSEGARDDEASRRLEADPSVVDRLALIDVETKTPKGGLK